MDLHKFVKCFGNEQNCHDYLASIRWKEGVSCIYCNSSSIQKRKESKRYRCGSCKKSFSATARTIFHASRIPLSKWFIAITLISGAKKGISSLQLARAIGVNKNTAWYLQLRIRIAMKLDNGLQGLLPQVPSEAVSWKECKERKRSFIVRSQRPVIQVLRSMELDQRRNVSIGLNGKGVRAPLNHKNRGVNSWFRSLIGQFHQMKYCYIELYLNEVKYKFGNKGKDMFHLILESCAKGSAVQWEVVETFRNDQ